MQCWKSHASGALGYGVPGHKPGRVLAFQAFAKLKCNVKIAQNHKRKSVWVEIDYDKLYKQTSYNPGRQVGPVKLKPCPGRGRGLVVDQDVLPGDTLLCCEPLGRAVVAAGGQDLLPPQLAEVLAEMQQAGALGPVDRARFRLLYDGSPPDSARHRSISLDDLAKLEDKLRRAAAAPKKSKSKGFGAPAGSEAGGDAGGGTVEKLDLAALGEAPLSPDELFRLTEFNSWGSAQSDPGVAALRGEPSQSIIGIWPEFSMLNHSCSPNTVELVVNQLLVVRAARDISRGSELTTSYLAELSLAPRTLRQEWLRGSYGFDCGCERCKAEGDVPAAVTAAVEAAYELASSEEALGPGRAAVAAGQRGPLRELEGRLAGAVEALEEAMKEAGLETRVRTWLRASAYRAYHTLAVIRDLPDTAPGVGLQELVTGGPEAGGRAAPFSDPGAPASLMAIMKGVAPGSDPQLYLALETLLRTAEAHSRDDPRVGDATKTLIRAHISRYGRVSDAVLQELIGVRSRLQHHLGRVTSRDEPKTAAAPNTGSLLSGSLFGGPGSAIAAASAAQLQEAAAAMAQEMAAEAEMASGAV